MSYKDLTSVIPTMQSISLLRSLTPKRKKKKKGMTKSAVEIIVGTELIKETSKII